MEVALMMDDLLNFTLDASHDDDDDEKPLKAPSSSSSLESSKPNNQDPDDHQSLPLPEFAEEELEWLSNKDAFPALETCFDILGDNPGSNHQSPVSVLENSASTSNGSTVTSCCGGSILVSVRYLVKAQSKKRCRHRRGFPDLLGHQCWWWSQANIMSAKKELQTAPPPPSATRIGRRYQHCLAEKIPQWRAGPLGPKTLCNACGVRYKSGRLVPEYRPASSPTFSRSSTAPPSRRRYRLPSNTSTSPAPYSPTSRRILIFNPFFFFLFLGLSLVLTEAAGSCSLSSH